MKRTTVNRWIWSVVALGIGLLPLNSATAQTAPRYYAPPGVGNWPAYQPSASQTPAYQPATYPTTGAAYQPVTAPYQPNAGTQTQPAQYTLPTSAGQIPSTSNPLRTASAPVSSYPAPKSYATPTAPAANPWTSPNTTWGPPPLRTASRRLSPLLPPDAAYSHDAIHSLPEVTEETTEILPEGIIEETPEVVVHKIVDPAVYWEGSFELGLNGSAGNSEVFNFRIGADAKRKTDFTILTFDLDYKKDSKDSVDTANRLFFEGRNEWLLGDSPWSIFVHGTTEYDEFKAFDTRLAADAGVGYQFLKTDITELKGRTGAGVSHELGGPDDSYPIEATFGLDYSRQLSEKQKISASVDYFPEFADFMNARITSKADWEILIDDLWNMSMKIGVIDRYDSTPNGAKHNDVDYSVTLLWKF